MGCEGHEAAFGLAASLGKSLWCTLAKDSPLVCYWSGQGKFSIITMQSAVLYTVCQCDSQTGGNFKSSQDFSPACSLLVTADTQQLMSPSHSDVMPQEIIVITIPYKQMLND